MNEKYFEILATIFFAVLAWIVNRQVKRIDQLEKDINSMRLNYLDRFDKVSKKLEAIHIDVAKINTTLELYDAKRIRKIKRN